jgi:hypothetical protein
MDIKPISDPWRIPDPLWQRFKLNTEMSDIEMCHVCPIPRQVHYPRV